MLKILHARLQDYVNQELPVVPAGFRKGRGTRDQIANIYWIIEKAREFQKNIYLCFINYAKALDWVDHDKLWKALREMGILDHLTCLLRNLYAGQEEQFPVWNWLFQDQERSTTGLAAVTLFVEFICWAHHEKCWAGWVTSWNQDRWKKHHNLRYVDDTTLMAESKEELNSLLMRVKKESESWFKTEY